MVLREISWWPHPYVVKLAKYGIVDLEQFCALCYDDKNRERLGKLFEISEEEITALLEKSEILIPEIVPLLKSRRNFQGGAMRP